MRKSTMSIIASAALFGAVLVGCGSSGGSGGGSSSNLQAQASNVVTIGANGLIISHGLTECLNPEILQATNNVFTLNATNMKKADGDDCDIINQPYTSRIISSSATDDEDKVLDEKLGDKNLEGFAGKKVNIFSTIARLQGKDSSEYTDMDANSESLIKIKTLLHTVFATNASADVSAINLADIKDGTITSINAVVLAVLNINLVNVNIDSLFDNDGNPTGDLATAINNAQNMERFNLNSVSMTVGSKTFSATENNFDIVSAIPTIGENDAISFAVAFGARNVEQTVNVKLKIENTMTDKHITADVTNVKINGSEITVDENTQVTLTTNAVDMAEAMGGETLTKTIKSEMINSDGTFKLDTVLDGLGNTDAQIVTDIKAALKAYITAGGEFELTAGVDYKPAVGVGTSNLESISDTDFDGLFGVSGNVKLTTAQEAADINAVRADYAAFEEAEDAYHAAISDIFHAETEAAVNAAKTEATTEYNTAKALAAKIIANDEATQEMKTDAGEFPETNGAAAAATDRLAIINADTTTQSGCEAAGGTWASTSQGSYCDTSSIN